MTPRCTIRIQIIINTFMQHLLHIQYLWIYNTYVQLVQIQGPRPGQGQGQANQSQNYKLNKLLWSITNKYIWYFCRSRPQSILTIFFF